MSITDKTLHGSFGKVEEMDHVKVTLFDGTVIEGEVTQINESRQDAHNAYSGGLYIGSFFIGWERVTYLNLVSRPTAMQKFELIVADLISRMDFNLGNRTGSTKSTKDYLPTARRVIQTVRDHDAKEVVDTKTEVTSVTEPKRVLKATPPTWTREFPEHDDQELEVKGWATAPIGSADAATPAHQDRV